MSVNTTNKDGRLYQGLLEAIGHRSLPKKLSKCIAADTFAAADSAQFRAAHPFPHTVLDNFLAPDYCQQLLAEFPPFHPEFAVDENGAIGGKATHNAIRRIGPAYQVLDELIQTRPFLDLMSSITGIPGLLYDPDYLGGGTHENMDGQSLDIHVDFNYHRTQRWHRRVNLILFLNEQWQDDWGGCLQLRKSPGSASDVSVTPIFNRAAIFETSEVSWHGFSKIRLPEDSNLSRKSIALYFYTRILPGEEKVPARSTVYVEEPIPENLVEGHLLNAEDMAHLRSLIDRRDLHIARLYQHERDLTARIFELEGHQPAQRKRQLKDWMQGIASKIRPFRKRLKKQPNQENPTKLPFVQFAQNDAHRHLQEGWGETETSMVWSLGPYSILEISLQKCADLDLLFECRPFSFAGAASQSVTVFLNDSRQGIVELSEEKQTYRLSLNTADQKTGTNTLRFEYGYSRSPAEVGESTDNRKLAVAWFNLWLSGAPTSQ